MRSDSDEDYCDTKNDANNEKEDLYMPNIVNLVPELNSKDDMDESERYESEIVQQSTNLSCFSTPEKKSLRELKYDKKFRMINDPNVEVRWGAHKTFVSVALKDIKKDEECFITYGQGWFEDRGFGKIKQDGNVDKLNKTTSSASEPLKKGVSTVSSKVDSLKKTVSKVSN